MRDDLRASALLGSQLRDLKRVHAEDMSRRRTVCLGWGDDPRTEQAHPQKSSATLRPTRIFSATFSRVPRNRHGFEQEDAMQVTAVKHDGFPAWRWRFVNDTGAMVEESRRPFQPSPPLGIGRRPPSGPWLARLGRCSDVEGARLRTSEVYERPSRDKDHRRPTTRSNRLRA